jgi:DNA-directed RNA polymerase specialized sigma24 family protein
VSEALFYAPAVLKVIRHVLVSTGVRGKQDLEDVTADVVVDCIEHVRKTGRPPENVAVAIAIARPIAERRGIDWVRKRVRHGKSDQGPTEDADKHAREPQHSVDPVDRKKILLVVREVLSDDEIAALTDVAAGVSQAELAAERGTSPAAGRKHMQRLREKVRVVMHSKGFKVSGGFAALVGGVALVLYAAGPWREPESVGHGRRDDERAPIAAEQRRIAADRCKERNWDECERALDRAARIDAPGERAAEVSALREAIAAGRRRAGAADGGGTDAR